MALNYAFLTELYRKVPAEELLLTSKLAPRKNRIYSPLLEVKVRVESKGMSVATLGKIGDPAKPINVQANVTEFSLTPPQIYEYVTITEEDVFNIVNPEILAVTGPQDVVSNMEYIAALKVEELKKRADRRLELMLAQILTDGQITYDDGNRAISFNFNIPSSTYTLSATTNVIKDLIDLTDEMRKNGANPDMIIITKSVENALFTNNFVTEFLNKNTFNIGNVPLRNYVNARETFAFRGLPPIIVYSGTYVDSSGNVQEYISGDKIILADSSLFRVGYGAIVNYKLSNSPIRGEAVVWEDIVNGGTEKAIHLLSRPLPYVVNSAAVYRLDVTIS